MNFLAVYYRTFAGAFLAEIRQLLCSRLFLFLIIAQAVTFLFLVSLFALTGSQAPTALVSQDSGPYAKAFIARLMNDHHSFALSQMNQAAAEAALQRGDLVAIITLPPDFSSSLAHGSVATINVTVDNVNTDMTNDIQRALPSAIVVFGRQFDLPGIRVHAIEVDLINHDTGFVPYLVVSALALDAFMIACILSAMVVAREFEAGTVRLLAVAPLHPLVPILGRVGATTLISLFAMLVPLAIVLWGYGIWPLYPLAVPGVILLSVVIFGCIGVALGALLKRTLPVTSLVFGLSLPLYLASGSMEPQRFDGDRIWLLAHLSPVYYAVGILQVAFHGVRVTPESTLTNFLFLCGWAVVMLFVAALCLRSAVLEKVFFRSLLVTRPGIRLGDLLKQGGQWLWCNARLPLARSWRILLCLIFLSASIFWASVQQNLLESTLNSQYVTTVTTRADRHEEALLLSYMNSISVMLEQDHLLTARPSDTVAIAAEAHTLATLDLLDRTHKVNLVLFLYNSRLISNDYHVISLAGADLRSLQFPHVDLRDTDLEGANFAGSNFSSANLSFATLISVNLSNADLSGANMAGTELRGMNVANANLENANLTSATGMNTNQLGKARSLSGATLPDGTVQPGYQNDGPD